MANRKPETLVLIVALIGTLTVLLVFLTDLLLSRYRDLDAGEQRLQHFGVMMAEHTARSFEAIDVLLREMSADLSFNRRNWEKWEPSQGWEYVAQRHTRSMPQLRDLIIFDREGDQRFISTYFPPPEANVRAFPYFSALERGAESTTFGPYIDLNSGRYSYAIGRRISGADGRFAGIAFAAIEPAYLQDFCWSNRLSDDFEAVLVNARGEIIASCRPSDISRHSPVLGNLAVDALFDGELRGLVPEAGMAHGNNLLISVAPVSGFSDLRILTAIPVTTLLANWRSRLIELGTLSLLVTGVLLVGGLVVRRQVREMTALTAELAKGHELLEERVGSATLELAGQKDAAERANKAKSRFLAAASHDLRQPLHALSLFVADLQRQIRNGTVVGLPRLAEQIATSTTMLSQLLDSLLDISRLDVAGVKPEIRHFALEPLFERLAASSRRTALDRNLTLRFRPTRLWLESDPVMVERMIGNLVSNALRYTQSGGRILVTARKRGTEVQIDVRDNGIGIATEHQAAIFAEFYQIGNAAREHNKGLGLGLSIVDRLARALEAKVSLRSQIGQGTTFSLRLRGGHPPEPQLSEQAPPSAGRILCIGASAALFECIRFAESWDYTVLRKDDAGEEILPPQTLVLTEMALAETVSRQLPGNSPLMVLVASVHPPLPPGAHGLLLPVKPAKFRALINQLQKTLSKSMP